MRKISVLLAVFALLLSVGLNKDLYAESNGNLVLNGEAYLNVPLKGWTSLDQAENNKAKLKVKNMDVDGNEINLKGVLDYNGNSIGIEKNGTFKRSKHDKDNLIINFNNQKTNLDIAHAEIEYSTTEKDLGVNKKVKGENVLSLYFFDKEKNDVIFFEQKLPGNVKKIKEDLNVETLEEAKTDMWAYKYFQPEIKGDEDQFSAQDAKVNTAHDSRSAYYYYGYGESEHYTAVNFNFTFADTISGQATATGTLRVTDQYVTDAYTGEKETGWSNLFVGDYNNDGPVEVQYGTGKYISDDADVLVKQGFSGPWVSASGGTSLTVILAYGPLVLSPNFPEDGAKQTIESGDFENLVTDAGSLPYASKLEFDGTYLKNSNHKYEVNVLVQHDGVEGVKELNTRWQVPFTLQNSDYDVSDVVFNSTIYYDSNEGN